MKILIAGAGEVGYNLIDNLSKEEMEITVVDTDPDVLYQLHIEKGINVQVGNVVDHSLLGKDHLKEYDLFLAITNSDETNMIACKMAKEAGVSRTICRIRQIDLVGKKRRSTLESLGIDHVINPVHLVADELYQLIQAPNIVESHYFLHGELQLIGYRIQGYCDLVGRSMREVRLKMVGHTLNPLLVQRHDRSMVATQDMTIEEGDVVYFLLAEEDHTYLRDILGYSRMQQKAKRIVINGGGHIGFRLARHLDRSNHNVKVIELDKARSFSISERLQNIMVLNFDGTEEAGLSAEGVEEADYFFSVTDKEEINLVSCLNAAKLGAKRSICLVKQQELISIIDHNTPINVALSPRMVTARYLSRFIKGTNVASYFSMHKIEVMEMTLGPDTPCLNTSLEEMGVFEDALIAVIKRGDRYIIPKGHDPLRENDSIVLVMHQLDRKEIFKQFYAQ